MSKLGLSVAALLTSVVFVTASPLRAEDAATYDYCTADAGFSPCPKLAALPGVVLYDFPAQHAGASGQGAEFDWCTADAGFARCDKLDQWIAMRDSQGPAKYASLVVPVE